MTLKIWYIFSFLRWTEQEKQMFCFHIHLEMTDQEPFLVFLKEPSFCLETLSNRPLQTLSRNLIVTVTVWEVGPLRSLRPCGLHPDEWDW